MPAENEMDAALARLIAEELEGERQEFKFSVLLGDDGSVELFDATRNIPYTSHMAITLKIEVPLDFLHYTGALRDLRRQHGIVITLDQIHLTLDDGRRG